MPVYSIGANQNDNNISYCLPLILVAVQSYYEKGNDAPLLVTTNNKVMYDVIHTFKSKTAYPFQLLYVTEEELKITFGVSDDQSDDPNLFKYIYSKFYPILKKMDDKIVHIDIDTMFTGKIPFDELFRSDIALVADSGSRFWINSGVFSVQNNGFDMCKKFLVDFYIQREEFTKEMANMVSEGYVAGYKKCPEEYMFNFLYRAHYYSLPNYIKLIPEFQYNFLAYDLQSYSGWDTAPTIVHFHWYKPTNCKITPDGPVFFSEEQLSDPVFANHKERINPALYKAVLYWFQYLYEVNDIMEGIFSRYLTDVTKALLQDHLMTEFEFEVSEEE